MIQKGCKRSVFEGGAGGVVAGAAIGAPAGPVGAIIGGIVGSVVGTVATSAILEGILNSIFDLPRTTAEEGSYKFFGVHHKAPNADVNTAYRKKARQYHPDRGGNRDKWNEVQIRLQIIRFSRGLDC